MRGATYVDNHRLAKFHREQLIASYKLATIEGPFNLAFAFPVGGRWDSQPIIMSHASTAAG